MIFQIQQHIHDYFPREIQNKKFHRKYTGQGILLFFEINQNEEILFFHSFLNVFQS